MDRAPRERAGPGLARLALALGAAAGWLGGCRPAAPADVSLTVIGTSDLHGHLEGPGDGQGGVALFGGYLGNLRRGHAVVLVDGGDLFQGTLVSNLGEGAPVVRAMNALGYHAAALGNHEFDYGPVGEPAIARGPGEDPRGALRARAREAHFRLLAANVVDEATGAPVAWDNVSPTVLVEVGGVRVGIVGGPTEHTPTTTNPQNLRGLRFLPLGEPIRAGAEALRRAGAEVVIAAVHAGSGCRDFHDPDDLSSCETATEGIRVARALPPGLVDVIVGGHTHKAVAHRVAGIPFLQAWMGGEGFGRVDLLLDGRTRRVKSARLFPPHRMRAGELYEGAPALPDRAVAATFADDLARAAVLRARPLGVAVRDRLWRSYDVESPLGNLVADLLREAVPGADAAIHNGGGLRAELRPGALTYDALYEVLPFDNRLAVLTLRGAALRQLLARNLAGDGHGFLAVSGLRGRARCGPGSDGDLDRVQLDLRLAGGAALADEKTYRVVVSDFLAAGGDAFGRALHDPRTRVEVLWDRPTLHDVVAEELRRRGGTLAIASVYDPAHPRIVTPGARPLCRDSSN